MSDLQVFAFLGLCVSALIGSWLAIRKARIERERREFEAAMAIMRAQAEGALQAHMYVMATCIHGIATAIKQTINKPQ